jgi:hypothetical protein
LRAYRCSSSCGAGTRRHRSLATSLALGGMHGGHELRFALVHLLTEALEPVAEHLLSFREHPLFFLNVMFHIFHQHCELGLVALMRTPTRRRARAVPAPSFVGYYAVAGLPASVG